MKEEEKADVLKQNGKKSNAKEALICHSGPAQKWKKSNVRKKLRVVRRG